MIKRKGQIVPRWLVKSIEPKAQHLIKFGCDCIVINKKITATSGGPVFLIPSITHVQKKKRQRTVKGFEFIDIHINNADLAIQRK